MLLKLSDFTNRLVEYITAILLFLMVIIIFSQVFSRHVLASSLSWSEELARYMFIWVTLLGISIGVKRGFLVSISIVSDRLAGRKKIILELISSILIVLFSVVIIYYGIDTALKVINQQSPAMRISMSVVYFSVPVGGVLILLHIINIIYEQIKKLTSI